MRNRFAIAAVLLASPLAAFGQADDARAMAVARETLDRGAALFDKRDAEALAATYVEDAEILLIKRASETNRIAIETRRGQPAIEKAYGEIFRGRQPGQRSRNTVESARFLGNDMLLIRGRFALDREQGDVVQFVQVRAREGDQWKIVTLQLLELPK